MRLSELAVVVLGLCLILGGCASVDPIARSQTEAQLFGPNSLDFHSFTKIGNVTGSGKTADGVDAQVEFDDQFGDPTKADGTILFELYQFRRGDPDSRGQRLAHWVGSIQTVDEQREQWNKITRTYGFLLPYPAMGGKQTYVLEATFSSAAGRRLFAHVVLNTPEEEPSATEPATDVFQELPTPGLP